MIQYFIGEQSRYVDCWNYFYCYIFDVSKYEVRIVSYETIQNYYHINNTIYKNMIMNNLFMIYYSNCTFVAIFFIYK